MLFTQILVHRYGPRTRIWELFHSKQEFTSWKTVADLLTFPYIYLVHQTTSLTGPDIFI